MELKHILMAVGAYFLYTKMKEQNQSSSGQPVVRDMPMNPAPVPTMPSPELPSIQPVVDPSPIIFRPQPIDDGRAQIPEQGMLRPGGGSGMPQPQPIQSPITYSAPDIGVKGPMNSVSFGPIRRPGDPRPIKLEPKPVLPPGGGLIPGPIDRKPPQNSLTRRYWDAASGQWVTVY